MQLLCRDNFYWCGIENTTDSQIKTDFITPYSNNDLVRYPWYNVLGNHEYGYNVQAQLDLDLKGLVRNWNLPARCVVAGSAKASFILFSVVI